MTTQHTRTKLTVKARQPSLRDGEQMYKIDGLDLVYDYEDWGFTEDDARRLVACWDACEGISTEALEKYAQRLEHPFKELFLAMEESERELMDQRNELLDALKEIATAGVGSVAPGFADIARAAIAKAERTV